MLEISLIAELSDDVAIIGSTEDIMTFKYVRMIQLFEGFNFSLKHFLFRFVLDGPNVNNFDCHFLLGLIVTSSVYN